MNKPLKVIEEFAKEHDWACVTPEDYYEILEYNGRLIYQEHLGNSRLWRNLFRVVELNGELIGYDCAETTGYYSPTEKGWEFDLNNIYSVEKKEETHVVVTYIPIKPKTPVSVPPFAKKK